MTTHEERERMIQALRAAWSANPQLRLAQLVHNAAQTPGLPSVDDVYYVGDAVVLAGLKTRAGLREE